MNISEILSFLYICAGFVSVGSYVPLIWSIATNNGSDQSQSSWIMWFSCSVVTLLYAIFVNHDSIFIAVSIGHLVGTGLVSLLVYLKKALLSS